MFTIRAVFFFLTYSKENTAKRTKDYFEVNKATTFGLIIGASLTIILKWMQWGEMPYWPVACWLMWGVCNSTNWFAIRTYVEVISSEDEDGLNTQLLDEKEKANKI